MSKFLIAILVVFVSGIFGVNAQTFTWETASGTGTEPGATVSETVSGITVTVSVTGTAQGGRYITIFDVDDIGGYGGAESNIVLASVTNIESVTFTFSESTSVYNIYAVNGSADYGGTWTYTPTGGSNSTVVDNISAGTGQTVMLNWTNVTSFTVTKSEETSNFAWDNLILEAVVSTPPTSQASGITFSSTSASETTVNWTRGDGDNCAVFMASASSGTASPADNNSYTANSVFGTGSQIGSSGWYCIYKGSGTSVPVLGLTGETTYRVHICEYNGGTGAELYLTDSETDNPNNVTTDAAPAGSGQITRITNPTDANGVYTKNGLVNGKQSWISSNGYYVYWAEYLSIDYWCIDIDTDPSNNVEFYIVSSSDVPPESGYTNGNGNGDPILSGFTLSSAPTDISLSSTSINENVSGGSTIGTLSTTDADAGDSHTYYLVSGTGDADNGSFSISGSNLIIISSPDYETKSSYSVRIQTDDGNGGTYEEAFTITINDLNDNTPVITASQSFDVDEDAANSTSVGTVAATDADAGTTLSGWTITLGNDDGIFAIGASSGEITVTDNTNLDYETTTSYTLTLTVSDGTNTSSSETVTIDVNNINDNAPVITASQSFDVDEDAANSTSVGTVAATDADAGTTLSGWTITLGNDDGVFAIGASSGEITVTDNTNLDYETTTSYTLTLTVSDGTNTSSSETVTIDVNNINDNAPVITASQSFSIGEDAINTTSVGTVSVSDADGTTTYSDWTITLGNDDGIFAIGASSGEITVADNTNLDYGTTTSYTLTLTVSDGTNTSSSETVTINVNEVITGVPEISESMVNIYPNPCTNIINIEGLNEGASHIIIHSVTGQIVLNTDYNGIDALNVDHLKTGIYFLTIENKEGVKQTIKVVKQ